MQKPHPNKVRTWSVNHTRIKRLVVRNWRITQIHTTRVMKGFERENKMLPNMLRKQQNAEQKKYHPNNCVGILYNHVIEIMFSSR